MNIIHTNNTMTVKLNEDIDHNNAFGIRERVDAEINKRPVKNLVFDLILM